MLLAVFHWENPTLHYYSRSNGEAERLAYAESILVILEDHEQNGESYKRGVEGARQSGEMLFRPESASRFVSRIVLAIGSELNGQSVASINVFFLYQLIMRLFFADICGHYVDLRSL